MTPDPRRWPFWLYLLFVAVCGTEVAVILGSLFVHPLVATGAIGAAIGSIAATVRIGSEDDDQDDDPQDRVPPKYR